MADELPVPVLLGKDLPLVKFIVDGLTKDQLAASTTKGNSVEDTEGLARDENPTSPPEENLAVMTRGQARTQTETKEQIKQEEQEAQERPTRIQEEWLGADFADDLFEDSRSEREQMTRAQKRENAQHYLQKVVGLTITDMVKEQQEDPEIEY